jgi:hypothetical protein
VFYPVKYYGGFIYFISHAIKNRLKNAATLLRSQWRDYYRPSSIETNVVPVSDGTADGAKFEGRTNAFAMHS